MSPTLAERPREDRPEGLGPRISLTWALLMVAIVLLLGQSMVGFVLGRLGVGEVLLSVAMALLVISAVLNARASGIAAARRQAEFESFSRLLQALSRCVSPSAVIDAIVHQVGSATQADYVAVVQVRSNSSILDVSLVSMQPGSTPTTAALAPKQAEPAPARRVRGAARLAAYSAAGMGGGVGTVGSMDVPESPSLRRVVVKSTAVTPPPSGAARYAARLGLGWLFPDDPAEDAGAEQMYGPEAREAADRIADRLREGYGLRNTLAAPLMTGEAVVGAIVLSRREREPWPSSAVRLLNSAAAETIAALSRVYSHQAAEAEARTDLLTSLANRRYFDEYCHLVASRRRTTDRVAILAVDVDHFKKLNDMYGHQIGDVVLRSIAGAIQMSVRDDDLPARYGGEEFMVLLRNPGPGVAVEVGERIRQNVREMDLIEAGVTDRVTVSVGVASALGANEAISDIVERADRALYAAKRAGRDRVVEAWPVDPN